MSDDDDRGKPGIILSKRQLRRYWRAKPMIDTPLETYFWLVAMERAVTGKRQKFDPTIMAVLRLAPTIAVA